MGGRHSPCEIEWGVDGQRTARLPEDDRGSAGCTSDARRPLYFESRPSRAISARCAPASSRVSANSPSRGKTKNS